MPGKFDDEISKAFEEALAIYLKKNSDYGDGWLKLGLKGTYFDIHRKEIRLRKLVWKDGIEGMKVKGEKLSDTFKDLMVIAAMGYALSKEYEKTKDRLKQIELLQGE